MSASARNPLSLPAITALNILRDAGFAKRPGLQKRMSEKLGRALGDDEFDDAMSELGRRIIRVRGIGGGIRLF